MVEIINISTIRKALEIIVVHYEETAPTVSAWADDLYIRLSENRNEVRISEVLVAQMLMDTDEGWEDPNYAANKVYHLMYELEQDTTGHIGF